MKARVDGSSLLFADSFDSSTIYFLAKYDLIAIIDVLNNGADVESAKYSNGYQMDYVILDESDNLSGYGYDVDLSTLIGNAESIDLDSSDIITSFTK